MKSVTRLRPYLPSSCSSTLFLIALGLLLVGCFIGGLFASDTAGEQRFLTAWLPVLGIFVLPAGAVLAQLAAWIEKKAVPRAALGCSSAVLLAAGGIALSTGMRLDPESEKLWLSLWIFWLPLLLVFSVPLLLALPHIPREVEQVQLRQRFQHLLELVESGHGRLDYARAAQALSIPVTEVDHLLGHLIETGQLAGQRSLHDNLFVSGQMVAEKQAQILGRLEAHAQVRMDDLCAEWEIPAGVLEEWLYDLAQSGRLNGYIHWDERLLYSGEARQLNQVVACPQCGGRLGMAGKGTLHCQHCGKDLFMAGENES